MPDIIMSKVMILPAIIIALTFHEYAHAKAADLLGDPTARHHGRVTLNPLAHIDILGFLALMIAGFGWGKPVPVNGGYFKHFKRDEIIVSAAGVTMNLLLAVVFTGVLSLLAHNYQILGINDVWLNMLGDIIFYTIQINIVLMIFNLIPCPPLDGFNIMGELLNLRERGVFYQIYEKGPVLLFLLIVLNVTDKIIGPGVEFITGILLRLFGLQ